MLPVTHIKKQMVPVPHPNKTKSKTLIEPGDQARYLDE